MLLLLRVPVLPRQRTKTYYVKHNEVSGNGRIYTAGTSSPPMTGENTTIKLISMKSFLVFLLPVGIVRIKPYYPRCKEFYSARVSRYKVILKYKIMQTFAVAYESYSLAVLEL